MLTFPERRLIENNLVKAINEHPTGIETRKLITIVLQTGGVPHANRHHAAGMLAWVLNSYNFQFLVRSPGYSIIA